MQTKTIYDILKLHGPGTDIATIHGTPAHIGTVWFYNNNDKEVVIQSKLSDRPFGIDRDATSYQPIWISRDGYMYKLGEGDSILDQIGSTANTNTNLIDKEKKA